MSEPVNPYTPPTLVDDAQAEYRRPAWQRHENRFVDAFATGTRLLLDNLLLIAAIVVTVWLPINLWISYYELFVIEPDDVARYLRMVLLMEGLFGVIGVGAVISVGAMQLRAERPSLARALGDSFSQWGKLILGGFVLNLSLVLGLFCLIVPGLYVLASAMYLTPVLIVERVGTLDALRECFALARSRFWFSLGLAISISLIELIAGMAMGAVSVALSLLDIPENLYWIVNGLLNLPADFVAVGGWLVILAAYIRLREELAAERAREYELKDVPVHSDQPNIS